MPVYYTAVSEGNGSSYHVSQLVEFQNTTASRIYLRKKRKYID